MIQRPFEVIRRSQVGRLSAIPKILDDFRAGFAVAALCQLPLHLAFANGQSDRGDHIERDVVYDVLGAHRFITAIGLVILHQALLMLRYNLKIFGNRRVVFKNRDSIAGCRKCRAELPLAYIGVFVVEDHRVGLGFGKIPWAATMETPSYPIGSG